MLINCITCVFVGRSSRAARRSRPAPGPTAGMN